MQSIHIIDHDSTDENVVQLLKTSVQAGAHVVKHNGLFAEKHVVLSEEMTKWKGAQDYLIPVDSDEFIWLDNVSPWEMPQSVCKVLSNLKVNRSASKFKFGTRNGMCPQPELWDVYHRRAVVDRFASVLSYNKVFFAADGFIETDQGNHAGLVKGESRFTPKSERKEQGAKTELILLHYEQPPYALWAKRILRAAYAYHFDKAAACSGKGIHYCQGMQAIVNGSGLAFYHEHRCVRNFVIPKTGRGANLYRMTDLWLWLLSEDPSSHAGATGGSLG
jgi:hypothetical protein